MPIVFHPDAAKRFDEQLIAMVGQATLSPQVFANPNEFPIDPYVSGTLTDADVIGIGYRGQIGRTGEEIARYTVVNGVEVGFEGETYKKIVSLAERMQRTPALREIASVSTVFDLLFDWLSHSATGDQQEGTASEYVSQQMAKQVHRHTVIIPLNDVFLQAPLRIGDIDLRTITREEIESWTEHALKDPEVSADALEQQSIGWRRELQGKAAAVYTLTAERTRASEITRAKAEDAVAMLRIFSLGMLEPRIQSFCTLKGSEAVPSSQYALLREGMMLGIDSKLEAPLGTFWQISADHAQWMLNNGLAEMSTLLAISSPTDFQSKLIEALLSYSRAALERGLAEKLLYVIVALETMLLRNETEAIQNNIAERLAFTLGKNAEDRKQISKLVKDAYGLRSKFVHHGHQVDDVSVMQNFLFIAFMFFTEIVSSHAQFTTKEQFIGALEERKWA